jgi:uncharacterized protein (DUF2141 family)
MSLPRRLLATALAVTTSASSAVAIAAPVTPVLAAAATPTPPADCTGPVSNTWITVVVDGVRSNEGVIAITLYPDDSKRFLIKHGSYYVGRVDAHAGTTRGCIFVPQPGVYALAIYHDEDRSGGFNRSGLGLPDEGYGFSNNPSTLAGLPAFSSVRLNIPRPGLVTRIHMKYP